MASKLHNADCIWVPSAKAETRIARIFEKAGFQAEDAAEVAAHLIASDCCGVGSHGIARTLQYVREVQSAKLNPAARPLVCQPAPARIEVEADGGIGIPALRRAVSETAHAAKAQGMATGVLRGAGHTGRIGAFAEAAAEMGVLSIILGGGNRHDWRQVAPYGGIDPILPTNPYCLGIPGGDHGPVVVDCATAKIAGGWIYAARDAGAQLPEGAVIDHMGRPTRDPNDYFNGGAILTKGEQLGSGLAVFGEMICEAMLGPVEKGETNWFIICIDCAPYRAPGAMQKAAESVLAEIRQSRPAKGFARVEIPGERERVLCKATDRISVPTRIWNKIEDLEQQLVGGRP